MLRYHMHVTSSLKLLCIRSLNNIIIILSIADGWTCGVVRRHIVFIPFLVTAVINCRRLKV